jgi:hypothetical protein
MILLKVTYSSFFPPPPKSPPPLEIPKREEPETFTDLSTLSADAENAEIRHRTRIFNTAFMIYVYSKCDRK